MLDISESTCGEIKISLFSDFANLVNLMYSYMSYYCGWIAGEWSVPT